MKKKPFIYIGSPGYDAKFYKAFEPLLSGVETHFNSILQKLNITSTLGHRVAIDLFVRADDPDIVEAYAEPVEAGASYKIVLSAGLSFQLWLASRAFASEFEFFPWLKACKVMKRERGPSRKARLADMAFYTMLYYVLLHELAHVVLGHCDFYSKSTGMAIQEISGKHPKPSAADLRILRSLEAEADRQSGEWLIIFFEDSLGKNGRGQDIVFPSRRNAYEFYSYAVTMAFVLMQQLNGGVSVSHPAPSERLYTVLGGIRESLKKLGASDWQFLASHSYLFMAEVATNLGLSGAQSHEENVLTALRMMDVDNVVRETNIRAFQHSVRVGMGPTDQN